MNCKQLSAMIKKEKKARIAFKNVLNDYYDIIQVKESIKVFNTKIQILRMANTIAYFDSLNKSVRIIQPGNAYVVIGKEEKC